MFSLWDFWGVVSLHVKSVTASRDVEARSRWASFESRHCRYMLGVVQSWESVVTQQLGGELRRYTVPERVSIMSENQ